MAANWSPLGPDGVAFGVELVLLLFNLIPAFPLDGGGILRGLLGLRMDWSRATRWATASGQGLAGGIISGDGACHVLKTTW